MRRFLIALALCTTPALASDAWFGGISPGFKKVSAAGSTIFAEDNFVDTTGDLLTSAHTMDIGGTWTANSASSAGQMTFSDANRVYTSTTGVYLYPGTGSPSDADYSVTAKIRVRGLTGSTSLALGVGIRYSTSALTGYQCTLSNLASGSSELRLNEVTAGSSVAMTGSPSASWTHAAGDEFIITITAVGDQITCSLTGAHSVTIGPVTDNSIAGPGVALIRGNAVMTNTTGYHMWYFKGDNTP